MADSNLQGFRQTYQETGKLSSGGGIPFLDFFDTVLKTVI